MAHLSLCSGVRLMERYSWLREVLQVGALSRDHGINTLVAAKLHTAQNWHFLQRTWLRISRYTMKVVVSRATNTSPELRRSRRGEAQDCGLVVYDAVWFCVCRRVWGIPASVIRVEGFVSICPTKCSIAHQIGDRDFCQKLNSSVSYCIDWANASEFNQPILEVS
jgi:hypothetical protein